MRSIIQIQIAVQENDPNITEEELRLCIESQRTIEYFYKSTLMELVQLIREDNAKPSLIRLRANLAWDMIERLFNASKKTPIEWLGADGIPGSPGQVKRLAWAKKVFEKATGEKL